MAAAESLWMDVMHGEGLATPAYGVPATVSITDKSTLSCLAPLHLLLDKCRAWDEKNPGDLIQVGEECSEIPFRDMLPTMLLRGFFQWGWF